jgi:hypothetical protein
MSPSTTRHINIVDSSPPSSFDWGIRSSSFPTYLSPSTTTTTTTDSPSSLPHNSGPIAMSFPVQTSYPYTFHDSHIPVQSNVPVNNAFSYPSPEIDLQHILEIPIGNHLLHDSPDSAQPSLLTHPERDHHDAHALLSPISVSSFMTSCDSPVDMRSPLDYPPPTPVQSPIKGSVVHTILPSSFPENHVINFDVSVSLMSPLFPYPLFPLFLSPSLSLNSIVVHVINRRTPSQNAPRRLNPRKRTRMQPHSSNRRSAPRNGVSSRLVSMSVASAVQKPALVVKNPPATPNCEILVLVPSISSSKSRLLKKSCVSTFRMSLS